MEEKLCSLDEWRGYYRRERLKQFTNDTFSRVRGNIKGSAIMIIRGAWAKNHIFSICRDCGRVSFYGVCHSCGFMTVCCVCHRVEMPDGSWRKMGAPSDNMSHSYCMECLEKNDPVMYEKIISKRGGYRGEN